MDIAIEKSNINDILNFDDFIVLTLHRAENVDDSERLTNIVNSLVNLNYNIIFPLHPHTKKSLTENNLYEKILKAPHIQITKPVGYLDFLYLLSKSTLVLTDSGGVQEEAITLNIPCVTLRYNTERPETITAGGNVLAGTEEEEIRGNIENILNNKEVYERMSEAANPYGEGNTSKIICDIIEENYEKDTMRVKPSETIVDFEGYYLKQINEEITVKDFEQKFEHHIIEQIFNNNLPEYIEENTNLNGKTIIVKEFKQE